MPEETAHERIVREAFESVNAGNPEAIKALAADDVVAHTRMSSVTGRPYRGLDGVAQWLSDIDEQFSTFKLNMDDVTETAAGRVIASGRAEVVGRGSDLPWKEDVHYLFEFEGDKVKTLRMFLERAEAERMAAGDE